MKNHFSVLFKKDNYCNRVIYISPEDINGQLSGGHIEALTDAMYLAELCHTLFLVYPIHETERKNGLVDEIIALRKNIVLTPVRSNSSLFARLLFSGKRAGYSDIRKVIDIGKEDKIVFGCHRNFLVALKFRFKTSNRLYFKSYGSISIHNFANLKAVFLTGFIDKFFAKRFLSMIFYSVFDLVSPIISNYILITRHRDNMINTKIGRWQEKIFRKKIWYNMSSPFFYFLGQEKIKFKQFESEPLKIGCIGDNTFPTAVLGLREVLIELSNWKPSNLEKIEIYIAGKTNSKVEKYLNKIKLSKGFDLIFVGYVDSKRDFFKSINGMLVPVSGGSAMPIKAIEVIANCDGPIFVTNYVKQSCGALFKEGQLDSEPKNFYAKF